jgi:hypothetical protein
MTRLQQLVVAGAALLVIMFMMPSSPPQIVSTASGLATAFQPLAALDPQPVLAAAAAPILKPGQLAVQGPPTISVEQIEAVLAEYNSPARGQGHIFYELGLRYNINPAIALAFFVHESGAGSARNWAGLKPDGSTTHNVGNIICTPGWRCHGRFRDYDSWEHGIEDWYKLINDLYIGEWQRTTVEEIIPKYAPAADNNNEGAYIQSVRDMIQRWQGR